MPMVPTFQREDLPQAQQTGAQADIGSAGQVGGAFAHLGQDATDYAIKTQNAEDYDYTSQAITKYTTAQTDAKLAAQDQATKTGDFKGVGAAFAQQLDASRQAIINGAPTPHAADAVALHTKGIRDELMQQFAVFGHRGEYAKWNSNFDASGGSLSMATYRNPESADTNYALGLGIIKGAQAAGIGGPDVDWQSKIDAWGKQNYGALIRRQIDDDPKGAIGSLQSGKYDFALHSEDVEQYTRMAQVASDRQDQKALVAQERALAAENRANIMAERQLHQTQAANEATLLGNTIGGKPVDTDTLASMVRSQQISPAGYDAIVRGQDGRDDPQATLHLYGQLGSGQLQGSDIMAAVANHQISSRTGVELQRGLNEQGKSGDSQAERGAFSTLKTALGGQVIEQGGIDPFGREKAQAATAWAQAQGEWNRRVIVGHEDPQAALADMIPKYSAGASVPTWLPAPQMGAITDPSQLPVVVQQTRAALAAGTITPDQFQAQGNLLRQYQQFFDAKAARDAAAKTVRAPKPQAGGAAPLVPATTGDQ